MPQATYTTCRCCSRPCATDRDALLCRIGDLLQQLVDKDKQQAPPNVETERYRCLVCPITFATYEEYDAHGRSARHLHFVNHPYK